MELDCDPADARRRRRATDAHLVWQLAGETEHRAIDGRELRAGPMLPGEQPVVALTRARERGPIDIRAMCCPGLDVRP
jgi:hypothetical protein